MEYNYYGDESCYLQKDCSNYMVIGAVACPKKYTKKTSKSIKQIKINNNLASYFEIKSTKISKGKYKFYNELINYFLHTDYLKFRAIIIDKSQLNHHVYHQTHNDFYYKSYYNLMKQFILGEKNNLYLDIKDVYSAYRCKQLQNYIQNHISKFNKKFKAQPIDSKESNILQLSDLLIGLVTYNARDLNTNIAKLNLIKELKSTLNIDLFSTNYNDKFNILNWRSNNNV